MAIIRTAFKYLRTPTLRLDILLIALLLLASFSINGLVNLQQIDKELHLTYQRSATKVGVIDELRQIALQRLLLLYQMYFRADVFDRETLYDRFQQLGERFIQLREQFESYPLNVIEKNHLNNSRYLFNKLSQERIEIVQDLIAGLDEATQEHIRLLPDYKEILDGLNKLAIAQSYDIRLKIMNADLQKQQAYWQLSPWSNGLLLLDFFIILQILFRHLQIYRKLQRIRQHFRQKLQLKTHSLKTLNTKLEQQNLRLKEEQQSLRQDISQLRQSNLLTEAANRFKGEFLANMSHEIRTPLNAVIGMTSLLQETHLNAVQQDYVDTINNSSDALLSLINDILDFSKINAGKLELEIISFSPFDCVEAAVDLISFKAVEKHLDILIFFDANVPIEIQGDMARLRQILINLLNNAIKFTANGEITILVQSRYRSDKHKIELEFTIKDTGIGLPRDKIAQLFESFSQLDASISRQYGGTGLGLSISKQLVTLMGGKIWVDSEPDRGSAFHFTIQVESERMQPLACLQIQTALQNKRILIVEPNKNNQRLMQNYTTIWGIKTTTFHQGAGVLDELSRQTYHGIILDMEIPDIHGLILCQQIQEKHPNIPILLLVSLGSLAWQEDDNRHLFRLHLHKPIKVRHFFSAVQSLLKANKPQFFAASETAIIASKENSIAREKPPTTVAKLRILMAEDNIVNQKVGLLLLNKLGYRTDIANNGKEALNALEKQDYDVILMDMQMPEMDGMEACKRIRADFPVDKQPYIIAMTAHAMSGYRETCLEAGMNDYVTKPVHRHFLKTALEAAVQFTQQKATLLDKT